MTSSERHIHIKVDVKHTLSVYCMMKNEKECLDEKREVIF